MTLWDAHLFSHAQTYTSDAKTVLSLTDIDANTPAAIFLKQEGLEELLAHADHYQSSLDEQNLRGEISESIRIDAETRLADAERALTHFSLIHKGTGAYAPLDMTISEPTESSTVARHLFLLEARRNNAELRKAYKEHAIAMMCFDLVSISSEPGTIFEKQLVSSRIAPAGTAPLPPISREQYAYANSAKAIRFQRSLERLKVTAQNIRTTEFSIASEVSLLWQIFEITQIRISTLESILEVRDETLFQDIDAPVPLTVQEQKIQHENFTLNHELIELSFLHQIAVLQLEAITTLTRSEPIFARSMDRQPVKDNDVKLALSPFDASSRQSKDLHDQRNAGFFFTPDRVQPLDANTLHKFKPRPVLQVSVSSAQHREIVESIRRSVTASYIIDNIFDLPHENNFSEQVCFK